jgi:hypothetical protein
MQLWACGIATAALLAPVAGWCGDSPSLQGQVLFLPRVDTPEQVGQYQNGTLRRNADGTWSVLSTQALGEGDLSQLQGIGSVVVHATDSVPSAIYLKVSGPAVPAGRTAFSTSICRLFQSPTPPQAPRFRPAAILRAPFFRWRSNSA